MMEVPQELSEKIYKLIESVKVDGKLRKGANEVTKSLEKNEAKMVVVAADVNPKEITLHFPQLSQEKNVPFVIVPEKAELGAAAGLPVGTTAISIVKVGEAKKQFENIIKSLESLRKKESKPVKEEPKKENKKIDETKTEKKEDLEKGKKSE